MLLKRSLTLFRRASANMSSGSRVPSMWRWSSAFGIFLMRLSISEGTIPLTPMALPDGDQRRGDCGQRVKHRRNFLSAARGGVKAHVGDKSPQDSLRDGKSERNQYHGQKSRQ